MLLTMDDDSARGFSPDLIERVQAAVAAELSELLDVVALQVLSPLPADHPEQSRLAGDIRLAIRKEVERQLNWRMGQPNPADPGFLDRQVEELRQQVELLHERLDRVQAGAARDDAASTADRDSPPVHWLTLRQAAMRLGCHKQTIYRHLDRLSGDEMRRTRAGYIQVRGDALDKLL